MDKIRYIRLTDSNNYGVVVKQEGHKFYGYVDGKWKRRGISAGYFYPDMPEYDQYEEITEEEAMKLISEM